MRYSPCTTTAGARSPGSFDNTHQHYREQFWPRTQGLYRVSPRQSHPSSPAKEDVHGSPMSKGHALAHYHLGFAYGMVGQRAEEVTEYLEAAALGLKKWDLFLNLGLAYLEQQQLTKAAAAFETAVSLGPEHAETHLNLAIVYKRERNLREALQEITASRRLAPEEPEAGNTNAIICAEMGDLACARGIWTKLVRAVPDYTPARANLLILDSSSEAIVRCRKGPPSSKRMTLVDIDVSPVPHQP